MIMQKSKANYKCSLLLLTLCCAALSALAQPRPLGTWRQFQRYNNANSLAVSNEDAFISTAHAVLRYDKSDGAL